MEIRYGKSASAMADPSLIHEITSQYPQIKVKYLPIKQSEYCLGNGIAIKKSNALLASRVKVATEELIAEKKVAELEKKWEKIAEMTNNFFKIDPKLNQFLGDFTNPTVGFIPLK